MKILRIFLVVAVLFGMSGLAGCGDKEETPKPKTPTEKPAETEKTE